MTIWLSVSFVLLGAQGTRAQEDADAYLWLEEVEGERALSWVKQKNEATLAILQSPPIYEEVYRKALEILDSDQRIAYPSFRGEHIQNFWQDARNERGVWRRTTLEEYVKLSPNWEVLLDIDKLSQAEGEQWVYKGAAGLYPDYTQYLVYLSRGGSDAVVVREFDADARRFVQDGFSLPQAKGSVSWKDRDTIYGQSDHVRVSACHKALEAGHAPDGGKDRLRRRIDGRERQRLRDPHAGEAVRGASSRNHVLYVAHVRRGSRSADQAGDSR
jgi:hypothetical protein